MKLDISIQIAVDHALVQKSEEIAEWTTQVANINEYVSINAAKPGNSSERMLIFFFYKKQVSFSDAANTVALRRIRTEISKRLKHSNYA